jgi:hypothetical protein
VITITTRKDGYDINNFTLLFDLFPICSELIFITQPDGESHRNHEDKDNKRNIDIPFTTSAIERRMLEYMATQTQTLQAMTQTMVNIH